MKIKSKDTAYEQVIALPREKRLKPRKQSAVLRILAAFLSGFELREVNFTQREHGMESLSADEPALFLMNHSSFIDIEIIAQMLKDRPYHIVCTRDGFVGKAGFMHAFGCIPTEKFVSDMHLVRDMKTCIHDLRESVVMYPEASYSFDGTATPLPESVGKCVKFLKAPVVMVRTHGAFLRDPLYNNLQKRKVDVSADVTYLLSPKQISNMSVGEINAVLKDAFAFDHFAEQHAAGIEITEPFRADGLHRALYKCPNCLVEGQMEGKGVQITCKSCGTAHELSSSGKLSAEEPAFDFVPQWYEWERTCVRKELLDDTYRMELPVRISMLVDTNCLHNVGTGVLVHDSTGFRLKGCNGELDITQSPKSSYSLYADYYWYEIGDMIAIGDAKRRYYCFPVDQESAIVAKARLATEELFKLHAVAGK